MQKSFLLFFSGLPVQPEIGSLKKKKNININENTQRKCTNIEPIQC